MAKYMITEGQDGKVKTRCQSKNTMSNSGKDGKEKTKLQREDKSGQEEMAKRAENGQKRAMWSRQVDFRLINEKR